MTLTSQTNRVQYSGDGSTTAFPTTFVFWLNADIQAIHTDAAGTETIWVSGAHFTLTVATSPTDHTPASGETLTITSNLDDTQDILLPEGGAGRAAIGQDRPADPAEGRGAGPRDQTADLVDQYPSHRMTT